MSAHLSVQLLTHTPDPDRTVAAAGRLCYAPVSAAELSWHMSDTEVEKLVRILVNSGHHSALEHASFTFAVDGISRACSHQLVRHRVASYCLSGDTIVYTDMPNRAVKKRTLKELFFMAEQYKDMTHIRCADPVSGELLVGKISSVTASGKKPVYRVVTEFGDEVKATLQHKFFTTDGWKRLGELTVGSVVQTNGIVAYKNAQWLEYQYCTLGLSQNDIASACGVSPHTIRSWVRKFGLQKEPGSWSKGKVPPNKGLTKETYEPLQRVSDKMRGNTNCPQWAGTANPAYKDDVGTSGGYSRTHKLFSLSEKCECCGAEAKERHHVDRDPTNTAAANVKHLCVGCHKLEHHGAVVKAMRPAVIVSIDFVGEEDTYDIEMVGPHHNFVASGFIVHNSQQSQRYVNFGEDDGFVVPPDIAENKEAYGVFKEAMQATRYAYEKLVKIALDEGQTREQAQEDARFVLPNAAETKIVVTMNARELRHFFQVRCCNRAQWEIRELAWRMRDLCKREAPNLFAKTGPGCMWGKCPEGKMTCGKPYEPDV
jgi:thymidylate synthase ThyX